jgi:hypothetical protein
MGDGNCLGGFFEIDQVSAISSQPIAELSNNPMDATIQFVNLRAGKVKRQPVHEILLVRGNCLSHCYGLLPSNTSHKICLATELPVFVYDE